LVPAMAVSLLPRYINERMTKGLRLVQHRQLARHIIRALSGSACHSRPQRLLTNPFIPKARLKCSQFTLSKS